MSHVRRRRCFSRSSELARHRRQLRTRRGWKHYQGTIHTARIVPPTSQNQAAIEDDLRRFVEARLDLETDLLTWECEQAIRNYDPCISCATHFLRLEIDRA